MSTTPTLDPERLDQMRTFLTTEAAADVAQRRTARTSPGRRALVGATAAVLLGGGLLATNAVVGGPGPATTPQALAIEQSDGWTTISLRDPDASAERIAAELAEVGIDATIAPLPSVDVATGSATIPGGEEPGEIDLSDQDDVGIGVGATSVSSGQVPATHLGEPGEQGLALLAVDVPALEGVPLESLLDHDGAMGLAEEAGFRLVEDEDPETDTIQIRDGADVTVVIYVEA